jgi:exosortase
MARQRTYGPFEGFRTQFLDCWQRLPNKGFFLSLLAAWMFLFQFLGNSTLGYTPTRSLLHWMYLSGNDGLKGMLDSDGAISLLIPFVVFFLLWLKRKELMSLPLRLWWPGLLLLAASICFHLLGYAVQQPRISIVALFTGIYALAGLAWGPAWLRATFFPFFLFGFCIPLGSLAEPISFRLRLLVSQLVEIVSQYVLQIDVIREGNILRDPGNRYTYEVVAACSGIRSLIATLAMCVILAFVSCRTPWKRIVLIASAFPLAILGNLVRMLSIIVAAEVGGQASGNWIHEGGPLGIFSLLPYLLAFGGLFLLERHLREQPQFAPPQRLEPKTV